MAKIHSDDGFTLIDIMVAITVLAILSAGAVPAIVDAVRGMRLGQAQRDVYQELQTARLVAVSSNRPIRIKFNCPVSGEYRIVELVGTPSSPDAIDQSGTDRCSRTKWKYPANDNDTTTRPNHDGPVRDLPDDVKFGAAPALEFWPDGTVHRQLGGENPWTQAPVDTTGVEITVVKDTTIRKIRVNGLGKIQLIQ